MRISAAGRALGRGVLDALFPPACLSCDAPVADAGGVCPDCFAGLSPLAPPFCARCGVPFAHAAEGEPGPDGPSCAACWAEPPPFRLARAALRYDDGARALILPFKHRDRTEIAAPLAAWMARAGRDALAGADALVPVPLHRWRLWRRRHNQAALLAGALSRRTGLPHWPGALVRARATQPLGELSAEARRRAVSGAFAVPPAWRDRVRGKVLVLVDDVMTSGATARACAEALLHSGAAELRVLAAARVPDPRPAR